MPWKKADWKRLYHLAKWSVQGFSRDDAFTQAAAISYSTIFTITPLLLVVIAILGAVYGSAQAHDRLLAQVGSMMGDQGRKFLDSMLRNAARNGTAGSLVGIGVTLVGATSLFARIKQGLNQVWDVAPTRNAILQLILSRLTGFGLVLAVAALFIIMLATSTVVSALWGHIDQRLAIPGWVFTVLDFLVSVGIATVIFAIVYKWLPDARIDWREAWIGAAITAVLFAAGKVGLGIYLGRSGTFGIYGAAASLVVVLVWVYYSSAAFLLGAEVTQCHAKMYGKEIVPAPWAQRVEHNQPAKTDEPSHDHDLKHGHLA